MSLTFQLTPVTPLPLLPTAPTVPATWVPVVIVHGIRVFVAEVVTVNVIYIAIAVIVWPFPGISPGFIHMLAARSSWL